MGHLPHQWMLCPMWKTFPTTAEREDWDARGGHDLIAYGTPATPVPSLVYSRYLQADGMPMQYPDDLVQYLIKHNISRVVVGHTPHGNCPTLIRHHDPKTSAELV